MNRNDDSFAFFPPDVDIKRSAFDMSHRLLTTFNTGDLIPILQQEVLPGDTFEVDLSSLVRMSTPLFPTMDNSFLDVYFFFVPNRLVWDHWKEFNGENNLTYWESPVEYSIPQLKVVPYANGLYGAVEKGSTADYFGIPLNVTNISVSALPFRAYGLIWNEWFRSQNTMQPCFVPKDDNDRNYYWGDAVENHINYQWACQGGRPLPVCKFFDYFTGALPSPQKGPGVSIPLLGDAPVYGKAELVPTDDNVVGSSLPWHSMTMSSGTTPIPYDSIPLYLNDYNGQDKVLGVDASPGVEANNFIPVAPNNLWANLSSVAGATINQLRQAFAVQKLFERDARGGTRYREILKAHFGVSSPDATMQIPEYLGGKRIPINIDQVLQNSSTNQVSPLGTTGGFSLTSDVSSMFTKSFTEHGYIIGVACVRTEHSYQQGIERSWSRKRRFDFYWPALANIGEQAILSKEIYARGDKSDEGVFGYQEAWAEYRHKPNRISGAFRSTYAQSLDSWHYGDYYDAEHPAVLSESWLKETRNNVDRTLAVTSNVEDQFLCDFYFKVKAVRPMPLYSVPGLIDHN